MIIFGIILRIHEKRKQKNSPAKPGQLFKQNKKIIQFYFILAAHCFTEPDKPDLYMVIFGKNHRSYGIRDPTQKEYEVTF